MQKCGFCSLLSGLVRRAMCVGSRRDSSESYYCELGDQDTLKIEDKTSDLSEDAEEETSLCEGRRGTTRASPRVSQRKPSRAFSRMSALSSRRSSQEEDLADHPALVEKFAELDNMKYKSLIVGRFLTLNKRPKKRLATRSLLYDKALLDDLSLGQVQCMLNQSAQWKFNAFALENVSGGRCLTVICLHLFHLYGLLSYFNLDVVKVLKLFSLIEEGYHNTNPYHNSIHAADVTQAMHCFLQQKQIREHLTPLEIMASLLAAIAHDMDHPGVNQQFLIATSNHLATLYRNTSVLENHHWRSAISCLIESGILDNIPAGPALREKLETQISSLILATDITRQQEYLSRFKNHLDTNTLDMTKSEHRHLVLQIALKCADISNPCRPWEISRKWSLKVCEEFFRQGDYERKLNLPVTALCDRHTTSIPKIQTGFFKYVVTPLISEWHKFLQNDLSSQMLSNLKHNQNKWETLMLEEQAEETRTEISDTDMVEDDLETCSGNNISDSSELLLPPRRSSLNTIKQAALKEQLRRFSVPLNVFQDSKFKSRDKSRTTGSAEPRGRATASPTGSGHSIHSQLSVRGHCEHAHDTNEKVLSAEKLLPDSSIASITTPVQATRLNTVLKEGTWKLVRQQTFPPLETTAREQLLATRPLYTSNEDAIYLSRLKSDVLREPRTHRRDSKLPHLFVRDIDKTETAGVPRRENADHKSSRRESSAVGSQLRDNLTSMPLGLDSDPLLQRRRKSMPADAITFTPKERKIREVASVLPQFVRRTLSGKEAWSARRGSAPSPVAASELRGLASLSSLRHSVNGGRRKPSAAATCQQWLSRAPWAAHDRSAHQLPRRSSLPVEVYHNIGDHT